MLLSQAIAEFDLSRVGTAPSTRHWYKRMLGGLLQFLGDTSVTDIRLQHLRRWHQALADTKQRWGKKSSHPAEHGPLSPWTVRAHLRAARIFFAWLHDEGHIKTNPARRLKLPPEPVEPPKAISLETIHALLDAARSARDRAIITLLADSGCRVGGLCNLKLEDLDLSRGRGTVREKGKGGGHKARTIYLTRASVDALERWLDKRPPSQIDHVFVGQRGPLTPTGVYQMLKRTARRAGVERFNPHSFRHGWARGALQNGADLGTVAQVLGHSSIEVTHRFYARWADDELAERHRKFSWMNHHPDAD